MNFISNIYSKIVPKVGSPPQDTQRRRVPERPSSQNQNVGVEEFYDADDGFVVYNNTLPAKKCKTTEINSQKEIERMFYQKQVSSNFYNTVEKSFLTVSDVPMVLSKPLQAAMSVDLSGSDNGLSVMPSMDRYKYDFSLERSVLSNDLYKHFRQ